MAASPGDVGMIEVEMRSVTTTGRPVSVVVHEEPGAAAVMDTAAFRAWKSSLVREMHGSIATARWSTALMGVAWIHLFCFLACQAIYSPEIVTDLRHPVIWLVELFAVLGFVRRVLGRGWIRSSQAIQLVAKLWISFLILSFNVVSLNAMTGFELSWFKPVWGTLSSFLFASLAWLFTPLFLIPAVQMWVTGLLMVHLPNWSFLIYGVSWWLALTGIALYIQRKNGLSRN